MLTEAALLTAIIAHVNASGTAGLGNNYTRVVNALDNGLRWNGDLRVQSNNAHKGHIHSWQAFMLTQAQVRHGARIEHYKGVRLRGYLYFWDEGDDNNSSQYVGAEVEQIMTRFANHKDLALDQTATGFQFHDEIQETNRAVQHAGNGAAHVVNLYLGCRLFQNLTTL